LNPELVPPPFAHRVGSYIRWVLRPWSPIPWGNNLGLGHGALTRPVPPSFVHRVGSYIRWVLRPQEPSPLGEQPRAWARRLDQAGATAIRPQSGLLQGFARHP